MSVRVCLIALAVACFLLLSVEAIREPEVHKFETATHKITIRVTKNGEGDAPSLKDVDDALKEAPGEEAAEEKEKQKEEVSKEVKKEEEKKVEAKEEEKAADAKADEVKEKAELKEEKEKEKVHEEKVEEEAKDKEVKAKEKLEEKEADAKAKEEGAKAKEKESEAKEQAKIKEAEAKEKKEIAEDKAEEAAAEKKKEKIEAEEPKVDDSQPEENTSTNDDNGGEEMVTVPQSGPVGAGSAPEQPDNNGCTENCEADEAKPVEAAGPTGMSSPLGDPTDPEYAPVKDTQTSASPPPEISVGCGGAQPGECDSSLNPPAAPAASAGGLQNLVQEAPTPTIPIGGAPRSVMTAPGKTSRAVQAANNEHGVIGIAPRFQEEFPKGGSTIHINIMSNSAGKGNQKEKEEEAKEEAKEGEQASAAEKQDEAAAEQADQNAPYQPKYGEAPPPGHYLKAVPLGAQADLAVAEGFDTMAGSPPPYTGNIQPATPTMPTPNSVISTMPLSLNNLGTELDKEVHHEPSGGCGCGSCPCQQQDCGCVVCPCPGPAPYPDLIPGFGKAQCADMSCMSATEKLKYQAKMSAEREAQKEKARRDEQRERLHEEMYKHQANYNAISRMARALRFQYAELKRTHDTLRGQIMAAKGQLSDVKNMKDIDFDNIVHQDNVAKLGQTLEIKHKGQTAVLKNAHEVQKYEMCVFFHKDPLKCPKPEAVQKNEEVAAAIASSAVEKPELGALPPIDQQSSKLEAKEEQLKEKEQELKQEEKAVEKEQKEVADEAKAKEQTKK